MRAVYRDNQGRAYSAPLELHGDQWLMRTSDGLLQPIEYSFKDDKAGRLTFSHYREDQSAEPDAKLHLLPRQPGESRFAQLQRTVGMNEMQARAERQQAIHDQVEQADAQAADKARQARGQARAVNTQLAQRSSPKRPESVPPQIPAKEITAEQARWRKRKMEPEA